MGPLLVLLLATSAPGAAGLAEEGMRAYQEMDLDGAREAFSKAQRAATPRERPRLELWLGIVELERGNDAASRRWLRSALQASPGIAVPASVSPKVRALVDELRPAARQARQARVASRVRPTPAPPVVAAAPPPPAEPVEPAVAPPPEAPAEPVAALTVPPPDPMQTTSPPAAPTVPAPAPALAPTANTAPKAELRMPPPLILAGAGASAVAVGALGGGVLLGVLAQDAAQTAEREALAVDASARFDQASATAWAANGLYAIGAVAAVVGISCATVELTGVAE